MAVAVAEVSTKGGVANRTAAAILGGILTGFGADVVLIDMYRRPIFSGYKPTNCVTPRVLQAAHTVGVEGVASAMPAGGGQNANLAASDGHQNNLDHPGASAPLQDTGLPPDGIVSPTPPGILSARARPRHCGATRTDPGVPLPVVAATLHSPVHMHETPTDTRTLSVRETMLRLVTGVFPEPPGRALEGDQKLGTERWTWTTA